MKTKRRLALLLGLASMLLVLPFLHTGCIGAYFGDGYFAIRGTVYEWPNAPAGATSTIYAESNDSYVNSKGEDVFKVLRDREKQLVTEMSLVPLEAAELTLDSKHKMVREPSFGWPAVIYSDSEGKFYEGSTSAPQRDTFVLSVSKPGYREAVVGLENPGFYYVVLIMVRDDNPSR